MKKLFLICLLTISLVCAAFGQTPLWQGMLSPTYGTGAVDPFILNTHAATGQTSWENVGLLKQAGGAPPSPYNASFTWNKVGEFDPNVSCTPLTDCTSAFQAYINATCTGTSLTDVHTGYILVDAGSIYIGGPTTADQVYVPSYCELRFATDANGTPQVYVYDVAQLISGSLQNNAPFVIGCNPLSFAGLPFCTTSNVPLPLSYAVNLTAGYNAGSQTLTLSNYSHLSVAAINAGTQLAVVSELSLQPWFNYTGSEDAAGGSSCGSNWGNPTLGQGAGRQHCIQVLVTGCNGQLATWAGGTGVTGASCTSAVTIDEPLPYTYLHNLPTWQANNNYGLFDVIQANGHTFANVSTASSFKTALGVACPAPAAPCLAVPNNMLGIVEGQMLKTSTPNFEMVKVVQCSSSTTSIVPVSCIDPTAVAFTANFLYTHAVSSLLTMGYWSGYVSGTVTPSGGSCTVNPKSFQGLYGSIQNGFVVGTKLRIGYGTANYEAVTVSSVTTNASGVNTAFTAPCAHSHNDGEDITTDSGYEGRAGAVSPDFASVASGRFAIDGSAGNTIVVWQEMGLGTDTRPGFVAFIASARYAGISGYHSVGNGNRFGSYAGGFIVGSCVYCWVGQVQEDNVGGGPGTFTRAYKSQVYDSFFDESNSHNSGQNDSTGLFTDGASYNLWQNNIALRLHVGTAMWRATAGLNVVAFNYTDGSYHRNTGASIQDVNTHTPGTAGNLSEHNVGIADWFDSIHGHDAFNNTVYRKWNFQATKVCSPTTYPSYQTSVPSLGSCATQVSPWNLPMANGGSAGQFMITYQQNYGFANCYGCYQNNWINIINGSYEAMNLIKAACSGVGCTPVPTQFAGVQKWSGTGVGVPVLAYSGTVYTAKICFAESSDDGSWPLNNLDCPNTVLVHGIYSKYNDSTVNEPGFPTTYAPSYYLRTQPPWWNFPNTASAPSWSGSNCSLGVDCTGDDGGDPNKVKHVWQTEANPAMNMYRNVMGGGLGGVGQPFTNFKPALYYNAPPPPTTHTITASGSGTANGTIVCTPGSPAINATITAGACTSGQCSQTVSNGATLTCTATATTPTGSTFEGWQGICSGATNPCTSAGIFADNSIIARFDLVPTVSLSCSPSCTLNSGDDVTLAISTTNLTTTGSSWVITAYDLLNPDGYTVVYCTPGTCSVPPCTMSSCTGTPLVNPRPVLPTTYVLNGITNAGISAASSQVTVNIQPVRYIGSSVYR